MRMASANELRKAYVDDIAVVTRAFEDNAFEHEKLTARSFQDAFRSLTLLNLGALVALSAAVALLLPNVAAHKTLLLASWSCFAGALILVHVARALKSSFIARRSEAERYFEHEQILLVGAARHATVVDPTYARNAARENRAAAIAKISRANSYRRCVFVALWVSAGCFLFGCYLGARALLG
jgi:hypothetical protein